MCTKLSEQRGNEKREGGQVMFWQPASLSGCISKMVRGRQGEIVFPSQEAYTIE